VQRRGIRIIAACVLLTGLLVGPAMAQDSGISGDLERTASASPQEKLEYAADAAEELREALKDADKLADDARRDGDPEELDCINQHLSQLRALAQVTEVAEGAMRTALEAGQSERADHELRKVAVALSKARQILADAQACTDDAGLASGDTQVRVIGGYSGDGDETDPLEFDVMDQGFDPPDASPFN
jgi:hypothetical protein